MSIATATHLESVPARPLLIPLGAAVGCVALADWLFYGWEVGVSLALFLGVLGIVALATNRAAAPRNVQILMAFMFVASLLPLIEDISCLSVIVGLLATALFVIVTTRHQATSWQRDLFEALTVPVRGPFQLAIDVFRALRYMKTLAPGWQGYLVGWIVPLGLFAAFLALFASANPLIENRLLQIHLDDLLRHIDVWRIWFWFLIICPIWPLIHRRVRHKAVSKPVPAAPTGHDYLLGANAVVRSLILFNALFALQSGLDLAYLWAGVSLPDGVSHAEYAHRGAYPLIATALLAAGFVLVAMRPGGPAETSRLIRPLVLVWTAQNILLVVSSIFRLDLYVAAYSLTYLRLAAFIWMGLVAIGLVLILVQIKLKKSNSWLLTANAISLSIVLYAYCFVNAPRVIASYNVEHCREISGTGSKLDVSYLRSLGPQAEPALRPYLEQLPQLGAVIYRYRQRSDSIGERESWRSQSFQAWRLERYLANNPYAPPTPSYNDGKG